MHRASGLQAAARWAISRYPLDDGEWPKQIFFPKCAHHLFQIRWHRSNFQSVLPSLWFRLLAEQDESLQYFASVGVNAYVSVQLSFLDESELSCTRAVARSFCPEFDHHMEVPCDLLLHSSKGETRSLAEELQEASAVFTLWNRRSHTGSVISDSSRQLCQKVHDLSMLFMFYASSWRRVRSWVRRCDLGDSGNTTDWSDP